MTNHTQRHLSIHAFACALALTGCGDDGGTSTAGGTASSAGTESGGTGSSAGSSSGTSTGTASGTSAGSASASGGSSSSGSTGGGSSSGGSSSSGSSSGSGTTSGGSSGGGSTGGGIPDCDMDEIPDPDDPFPCDENKPGDVALPFKVYPQTASTLFTMDVQAPFTINTVGAFTFDQSPGSVTDVAIDRFGVLYAITFNDLFVCNAATAECWWLADLPNSFNGLTMVPPGVLDPNDDTLIAIANSGAWHRVDINGNMVNLTNIGSYGAGYTNDGDVFSIEGVGTFGATNKNGSSATVIVRADPMTGMVQSDLATLSVTNVWGLAGWEGEIFAFDSSGKVLRVDPMNGNETTIQTTNHAWWGAGVGTVLPQ